MRKILCALALVMTVVFFVNLRAIDEKMLTLGGYSISAVQSLFSPVDAQKLLRGWNNGMLEMAKYRLVFEFGNIFLGYGFLLLSLGLFFRSALLLSSSVAVMLFDFIENFIHLQLLNSLDFSLISPAFIFSVIKYGSLVLFALFLVYAIYTKILKKMMHYA